MDQYGFECDGCGHGLVEHSEPGAGPLRMCPCRADGCGCRGFNQVVAGMVVKPLDSSGD